MTYSAPMNDIRFALEGAADLWSVKEGGRFAELDADLLGAILDAGAAFAGETLAPLNRVGDEAGLMLNDGVVTTPPGFVAAYKEYAAGGWMGLAADPAYGGQGLPSVLALAVMEMVQSANLSFSLAPLLSVGAIEAISAHGAPDQKALYLAKMISGEWAGTMNLTEPQAGSDLGPVATKAVPASDGSYRVSGQKIFITFGEHDFTDNIIHLVLARIEGAPPGSKGISLFIVPKFRDEDGSRNSVKCVGLEHKLGIHASPTCVMVYENATSWLIGEENKGLMAMFTMMNAARINVGMQGVAVAEAAYQKALAYARDRKQGGAMIVAHPDVKRMLATMRSKTQAGRALCYAAAAAADRGDHAQEALLTPICKAWSTDLGVEAASLGVQIHGGMGFVEETGAAQFYRDARIAPIYEGANGIQAIDLYHRKLLGDRGEAMRAMIAEARQAAVPHLREAADALEAATDYMLSAPRDDALTGAYAYLELAGDVIGASLIAAGIARAKASNLASATLDEQSKLLAFFAETVLARAPSRLAAVKLGAAKLDALAF